RENPNVISSLDAVEARDRSRIDFQSCIGSALPSLTGSAGALLKLKGGMYIADRRDIEVLRDIHNRSTQRDRSPTTQRAHFTSLSARDVARPWSRSGAAGQVGSHLRGDRVLRCV